MHRGSTNSMVHADYCCPAVELIGVTVFRSRLPVLCDISLVVHQCETVAIMGPNGAGKSTLLKCLSGRARFNCGAARWYGNADCLSPVMRRQIGFVGHECSLYGELTALENVIFAGRMHGVKRPVDRAMRLLEASGLDWTANRPTRHLSQGMRRRLEIARALVHEPALVLLDEPFASLDVTGLQWLERILGECRSEGRTVCFTCHDISVSSRLADRIVWLDRGHIVAIKPAGSTASRRSA
jgi:ABC-type multidrug transport system ATPase subunit